MTAVTRQATAIPEYVIHRVLQTRASVQTGNPGTNATAIATAIKLQDHQTASSRKCMDKMVDGYVGGHLGIHMGELASTAPSAQCHTCAPPAEGFGLMFIDRSRSPSVQHNSSVGRRLNQGTVTLFTPLSQLLAPAGELRDICLPRCEAGLIRLLLHLLRVTSRI